MRTTSLSVGVVAPYRAQLTELRNALRGINGDVEVSTVDAFQGREKDYVIVSCVRAGNEGVGFLRDERRLNVALTRAKHGCVVIGREATLRTDARWRGLLEAACIVDVASSDAALESLSARGAPVLGKRRREEAEDGELEDVGIL